MINNALKVSQTIKFLIDILVKKTTLPYPMHLTITYIHETFK